MMIDLTHSDISRLYGSRLWVMPGEGEKTPVNQVAPADPEAVSEPVSEVKVASSAEETQAPASEPVSSAPTVLPIKWGLKPGSQVIFIMKQSEKADKSLTELLKKIVESLEIPKDKVGFGFIDGEAGAPDLNGLPGSHAIVFGKEFAFGDTNPASFQDKPVFFAHTLTSLSGNRDHKLELWNYMKSIKTLIH